MFDLAQYSPPIQKILGSAEAGQRLMPLAPRSPLQSEGLELLRSTSDEQLLEGVPAPGEFTDCVRSALFLYFSALDESHKISQEIGSTTGSFLHGIMHRQEPDFSNSKYWFRRVGGHELFPHLRRFALEHFNGSTDAGAQEIRSEIEERSEWDPFWFVDQCEAAYRGNAEREQPLMEIQRLEWQLLFDYCYRRAVA